MKPIVALFALILLGGVPVAQTLPEPQSDFSKLDPQHRTVLSKWLRNKPRLRLATEKQDANKEGLEIYRVDWGKDFNPYYSVADFNRDGKSDFAVLVADSTDDEGFGIAIFNAPFETKIAPNYFERGYRGLSTRYIVYDRMERRRLYLGVYESDATCVTFYPRGRKYFFKDCDLGH